MTPYINQLWHPDFDPSEYVQYEDEGGNWWQRITITYSDGTFWHSFYSLDDEGAGGWFPMGELDADTNDIETAHKLFMEKK
jgi:hypothetical protein